MEASVSAAAAVPAQRGAPTPPLAAFRRVLESSPLPTALVAGTDAVLVSWANRAFCDLVGIALDDLTGRELSPVASPSMFTGRRSLRGQLPLATATGHPLTVPVVGVPLGGADDSGPWAVVVVADAREASRRLAAAETRLQALAEHAPVGILFSDCGLRVGYVNDRLVELFGRSADDLLGLGWVEAVVERDRDRLVDAVSKVLAGAAADITVTVRTPTLSRLIELRIAPVAAPDRAAGFVATVEDITQRRAAESELRHQALHDQASGLGNRRLLEREFAQGGGPGRVLLLVGISEFTQIVDSLGQSTGEELAVAAGRRLVDAAAGVPVVRLGADEFAVLLPAGAHNDERRLVELIDRVTGPVVVAGITLDLAVHAGHAVETDAGIALDEMLRRAHSALGAARRAGPNSLRGYDPAEAIGAKTRLALIGDLRQALSDGALVVHYQPVVDLRTGRPVGVEALARWPHPVRGPVPPDVFVPLAETTGMIAEVSRHMLAVATGDLMAWPSARAPEFVSVNISALQLGDPHLPDEVAAALGTSGLDPSRLVVELTETALMSRGDEAVTTLARLSDLGVRVALDDFGTGHSSLTRLHRFPLSHLKIDRTFVADLGHPGIGPILEAVVTMAHSLGLEVISEGVETREQQSTLLDAGIGLAQGWRYAKALPLGDLHTWWAAARPNTGDRT